jgi:hypothetical protein
VLVEVHPPRPARPEPFVGRARGAATEAGDLIRPLDDAWEVDAE